MQQREIEKEPDVPYISAKARMLLSDLCFRNDSRDLSRVTDFLVMGTPFSHDELKQSMKSLLQKATSIKKMVISGGVNLYEDSQDVKESEAKEIYNKIKVYLPSEVDLYLEEEATNTLENVEKSLRYFLDTSDSLCFISQNFHAGRCFLALQKYYPQHTLYQWTFEPLLPQVPVRMKKSNWFEYPYFKARVWGEYLRIRKYGERGDFPIESISSVISQIAREIS